MRWWLFAFAGLVGLSVVLAVVRPATPTTGARLLRVLEEGGQLRGAVEVVDYVPEGMEGALEGTQWGDGGLPGRSLGVAAGAHWGEGPGFRCTWQVGGEQGLRAALLQDGAVRRALRGYAPGAVDGIVAEARGALLALGDETLMLAWLRADRARVGEKARPEEAARELLLLTALDAQGPVVVVSTERGRVYLVPVAGRQGSVALCGYDGEGRMAWQGVLETEGMAPAQVRRIAVAVAGRAYRRGSP